MTFKVSVAYGDIRLTAIFPTEAQAVSEARNQIEVGATDVRVQIVATSEEFSFEEFRVKIANDGLI